MVNSLRIETANVVVGLPAGMFVEYAGRFPNGDEFIVLRPEKKWDYPDFRLYVNGYLVPIRGVTRYRDGGTTEIKTPYGEFFFPIPFHPELKSTYKPSDTDVVVNLEMLIRNNTPCEKVKS